MAETDKLQAAIVKFRDERDWKQFHNPKDSAIALVEEATELLVLFRWMDEAKMKKYLKKVPVEVRDEVADVLYWILLIAHDLDIDIDKAFHQKLVKSAKKYPVSKSRGNPTKYTHL